MVETTPLTPERIRDVRVALGYKVADLEIKFGLDSTGDPAVWAWIILKAGLPAEEWSWENLERLRSILIDELVKAGVTDWPYVRFRDEAEMADPVYGFSS